MQKTFYSVAPRHLALIVTVRNILLTIDDRNVKWQSLCSQMRFGVTYFHTWMKNPSELLHQHVTLFWKWLEETKNYLDVSS